MAEPRISEADDVADRSDDTPVDAPRPDEDLIVDTVGAGATADAEHAVDDAGEPHVRWITRRRLAKWNGPRHPRDWRWFVAGVGRVLIATGLLLFGFVAYQLWGTGLETARAQRSLTNEFEALLSTAPPPPPPVDVDPVEPDPPVRPDPQGPTIDDGTAGSDDAPLAPEPPPMGPFEPGDPVARIEIPRIDVDNIVVWGVGPDDLKKGPGHFPLTPLPGHLGNAAIAGHRTTHGQPFRHVDDLEPGDEIVLTTVQGTFVYLVTGTQIVSPQDSHVVATTRPDVAELTLVSCHPVLSAAQRIVISAELDPARSSPTIDAPPGDEEPDVGAELPGGELPGDEVPGDEVPDDAADTTVPGVTTPAATPATTPATSAPDTDAVAPDADAGPADDAPDGVDDEIDDAFARGWFHDRDAFGHIALWGALLTLVSLLAYGLSRLTRRDLVGFSVGLVPFVVTAFFFFQNVNRLLPPGL